jgi:hypothetical protein
MMGEEKEGGEELGEEEEMGGGGDATVPDLPTYAIPLVAGIS